MFDAVIGFMEQEKDEKITGIVTKGAYPPKDLDSDSNTGWSIVTGTNFFTESVEMDFSKENAQRDFRLIFQKVNNKMLICNIALNDLDVICFVKIIKDFKVSNFEHIFSETGSPKKAEHPEFLKVKLLFQCTLAIQQSEWKLLETIWFD